MLTTLWMKFMRFTLKQLDVFYMAAQGLSLTRAAEKLFISTPAVSKHIRNLEETCGCKLFALSGKQLYLTEAGKMLLHDLKAFRKSVRTINNTIQTLGAHSDEPARLSVTNTLQPLVFPMLKQFSDRHPQIKFNLSVQTWGIQNDMLHQAKYALYLMGEAKVNEDKHQVEVLNQFRLLLVAHPKHPLANRQIHTAELKHEQFLAPQTESKSSLSQEALMKSWGVETPIIFLDSYGAILEAVKAGLGIALLPDLIVSNDLKKKHITKLDHTTNKDSFDVQLITPNRITLNPNEILLQEFLRDSIQQMR